MLEEMAVNRLVSQVWTQFNCGCCITKVEC